MEISQVSKEIVSVFLPDPDSGISVEYEILKCPKHDVDMIDFGDYEKIAIRWYCPVCDDYWLEPINVPSFDIYEDN